MRVSVCRTESADEADTPVTKKPKTTSAAGNTVFDLGGKKKVTVSEFKGRLLVNLREFYSKDGEELVSVYQSAAVTRD